MSTKIYIVSDDITMRGNWWAEDVSFSTGLDSRGNAITKIRFVGVLDDPHLYGQTTVTVKPTRRRAKKGKRK